MIRPMRIILLSGCVVVLAHCQGWGDLFRKETQAESSAQAGCSNSYTVGGTVSGLSGTLVLQNNGSDDLVLTSNGSFTFPTPVNECESYDVTVLTNPSTQFCHIRDNQGAYSGANVTNVTVQCSSSDFTWVQDAYLKASNAAANGSFGYSVAISGNYIIVGAYAEDSNQTMITNNDGSASGDNSVSGAGAAYVFKRDASGNWLQDAYLKASNAGANDFFGYSVAISGSYIVVGAYGEDSNQTTITNDDGSSSTDNSISGAGAAYVFKAF